MTFSLVARCRETGMFGVAVASSSPAVAARCAYARAGVGAVASQNVTDPALGPRGLDLLAAARRAAEAVAILGRDPLADFRQVLAVDRDGNTADPFRAAARSASGPRRATTTSPAAATCSPTKACRGRSSTASSAAAGHLGDRLLAAMRAGARRRRRGRPDPLHRPEARRARCAWPVADLRIDWTEADPVAELAALWALYRPQLDAYVTRALDPTAAPSYGVPGDE